MTHNKETIKTKSLSSNFWILWSSFYLYASTAKMASFNCLAISFVMASILFCQKIHIIHVISVYESN